MTCPSFTVNPGGNGPPALWSAPIALIAASGEFGLGGPSASVRVRCGAGDEHAAQIDLWTPSAVLAVLPPDPGSCVAPFQLRVEVPRVPPPNDVCLVPLVLLDAPLFTGTGQLRTLEQLFRIEVLESQTVPLTDNPAGRPGRSRRSRPMAGGGTVGTVAAGGATPAPIPRYRVGLEHPYLPTEFKEEITSSFGVSQVAAPVGVEVRWQVTNDEGTPVQDVSWAVVGAAPAAGGEGGDAIYAPLGPDALKPLDLVFAPPFTELSVPDVSNPNNVVRRRVSAAVRVHAGLNSNEDWVDVPPVELPLPGVPFPTIFVVFRKKNFRSDKLVIVPAASPVDERAVKDGLPNIRSLFNALDNYDYPGAPGFGTFGAAALIAKLNDLLDEIGGEATLRFAKGDRVSFRVHLGKGEASLPGGNKPEEYMSNRGSSLFLIGPPGRQVRLFNRAGFDSSAGEIAVTCGREMFVAISDLHSAMPRSLPEGRVAGAEAGATFGNSLNGLHFGWAQG